MCGACITVQYAPIRHQRTPYRHNSAAGPALHLITVRGIPGSAVHDSQHCSPNFKFEFF